MAESAAEAGAHAARRTPCLFKLRRGLPIQAIGGMVSVRRRAFPVVFLLLCICTGPAVAADSDPLDKAEHIGWSDPDAGLALLDTAQADIQSDAALAQLLTLRGTLLVDERRDAEAKAIAQQLEDMGKRGLGV